MNFATRSVAPHSAARIVDRQAKQRFDLESRRILKAPDSSGRECDTPLKTNATFSESPNQSGTIFDCRTNRLKDKELIPPAWFAPGAMPPALRAHGGAWPIHESTLNGGDSRFGRECYFQAKPCAWHAAWREAGITRTGEEPIRKRARLIFIVLAERAHL